MHPEVSALRDTLQTLDDLRGTISALHWDMTTQMPPGGAAARARQIGTLTRLRHEHLTGAAFGGALERFEAVAADSAEDSVERDLLRVARRLHERARAVPTELAATFAAHEQASYALWLRARAESDFGVVREALERTVELSREIAMCHGPGAHILDPWVDEADEGMTTAQVRGIFSELRERLVPLVNAICAAPPPERAFLSRGYPHEAQLRFFAETVALFGYDTERGRLDLTAHPFMTRLSGGDVRITTRIDEHDMCDGLFACIHETGHALYELGVDPELDGTPLGRGSSSAVHESQSRLWENVVGRSLPFWRFYWPRLRAAFPEQTEGVTLEGFHRAINAVRRSYKRTSADELTYNLHVLVRFEIEADLLEGTLAVADLPERWRSDYEALVGVTPANDLEGVLQDVHWFGGPVGGAFHSYALGNVMSAQLYSAAQRVMGNLDGAIEAGDLAGLRGWLTDNVYRLGRRVPPLALIERVTGKPLGIDDYIEYLTAKYVSLYVSP
jgi:carboxypeptidase Taq